jgi:hypothetical protein
MVAALLTGWRGSTADAWGDAMAAATADWPPANRPSMALFSPSCVMHCGSQRPLHWTVTAAGTTQMAALSQWFDPPSQQPSPTAPPLNINMRWVDDDSGCTLLRGKCWGFSEAWVVLFHSLLWFWLLRSLCRYDQRAYLWCDARCRKHRLGQQMLAHRTGRCWWTLQWLGVFVVVFLLCAIFHAL